MLTRQSEFFFLLFKTRKPALSILWPIIDDNSIFYRNGQEPRVIHQPSAASGHNPWPPPRRVFKKKKNQRFFLQFIIRETLLLKEIYRERERERLSPQNWSILFGWIYVTVGISENCRHPYRGDRFREGNGGGGGRRLNYAGLKIYIFFILSKDDHDRRRYIIISYTAKRKRVLYYYCHYRYSY